MDTPIKALVSPHIGALVMASLAIGFPAGRLHGQNVYHACYVPNTGILYMVETEGVCKNDKHVAISWTDGLAGHLHSNLNGLEVGDDHPQYLLKTDAPDGHSLDAADGDPADALYVDDDGNVGIGTADPFARLHVYADDGDSPFHVNRNANGAALLSVWVAPEGWGYLQVHDETGSTRAAIRSKGHTFFTGGNVGIGTNNPHEKLEVAGRIETQGIKFPDETVQTTAGFSEITVLSQITSITAGTVNSGIALYCHDAGKIISGGYQWAGPEGRTWAAYPDPSEAYGHRYIVQLSNPTTGDLDITVYAVCVK